MTESALGVGPEDPDQNLDVLARHAAATVDGVLDEMAKKARDPEFRADPAAPNPYARYDALDAFISVLQDLRIACTQGIVGGTHLAAHHAGDPATREDFTELELLDSSTLELDIARTRHVQRAEGEHRDSLLYLELRLEELDYLSQRRIDPHGFHPAALFRPFEQALGTLELETEAKLLLLDLYAEDLHRSLAPLYDALNQALAQAGLLPDELALQQAVLAHEALPEPAAQDWPVLRDPEASPHAAADPHPSRGSCNSAPSGRPAQGAGGSTPSPYQPDPASLSALASHLCASTAETSAPPPDTVGLRPAGQGSPQVVQALSNVQVHQGSETDSELLDTGSIKEAVRQRLETDEPGEQTWEISESEERIIDFVNQIFISVFDDEALTDAVKALLSKLQIPVIKLALIDFAFFQLAQHPARRLLNQLVTLGARIDDKREPLFTKLQKLVDTIVDEFDTDASPFEAALGRLRRLAYMESEQARCNEAESQQEARNRAQRSAAKRTVVSTLNRHLRHSSLPDEAMRFILKCWAPYMGMIYLQDGTQSEKWGQAVYALRQIVEAARPDRSLSEVEQLIGSADQFFAQISQQLTESTCIPKEHEGIITTTRDWLKGFLDRLPTARNAPVQEAAIPCAPSQDELLAEVVKEEGREHDILASLLDSIPAEVKPGKWFEIYRGDERAKRRLKLSAILEESGQVLFADRSGFNALELDLARFLTDLREGRSKLIDDNNRFDHALTQVIDSIREAQERQQMA